LHNAIEAVPTQALRYGPPSAISGYGSPRISLDSPVCELVTMSTYNNSAD